MLVIPSQSYCTILNGYTHFQIALLNTESYNIMYDKGLSG